jgi:hypothetical protein
MSLNRKQIIPPNIWIYKDSKISIYINRIGGVMVSMLVSSAEDCWFQARSGRPKDYKIIICCFLSTQAELIKEKKQILVAAGTGLCIRVGRYVYPRTVVSVC